MLDKLKLNNHVTSIKTVVLKAKGQVIQNLIRRIRAIEKNSKSKLDSSKKESKITRLKDEILTLKKMNFREIVRNALLLERNPKVILSDAKAKTEERCFARMYEHKILYKQLAVIKEAFFLNEEENKKGLRSMGYSKTKKEKLKKKLKMKQEKKTKINEWIEEDVEEKETEQTGIDENMTENDESDTNDEPSPKNIENGSNEETKEKKEKKPKQTKESLPKSQNKQTDKKPPKPKLKKVEFSSESEDNDEDQVERVADSFFLTPSGTNYLATVSKTTNNDDSFNYKRPYKEDDDYEVETRINQREEQENYESNRPFSGRNNGRPSHFSSFNRDNRNNNHRNEYPRERRSFDSTRNSERSGTESDNLHPSWQAKQRQRAIQPFQGKKMKFDNDANDEPRPMKAKTPNVTNNEEKDLHPSWLAKQKAKPVIAEFVGKKITFDD